MDTKSKRIVITQIRTLMEFWQITVEDLQASDDAVPPTPLSPAKYRHPVTAESWDGQGPQPDWLRKALLQEGYRLEELRL